MHSKNFFLAKCKSFHNLPTFITQLNALRELVLSRRSNLKKITSSIAQLNAFQEQPIGVETHNKVVRAWRYDTLQSTRLNRSSSLLVASII